MSRASSVRTILIGVVATSLCAGTSVAQTARSGGAASAQLQMQLQQLTSERARMEAENAQLKKDLAGAQKELDSLKIAQKSLDARAKESAAALTQSKTQRDSTDEQLKQTKEKMEQLIAKFRETVQTLRDVEAEHTTVKQTLATREQQLRSCVDHNQQLYKINEEVLARLEHQSFWSGVAQAEPFTRIKRNQMENLVDDYQARAQDQRVSPHAETSAPSPTSAPPPSPPPASAPTASPTPQKGP